MACSTLFSQENHEKVKIDAVLNAWHKAASNADLYTYFDLMTHDGVFIGSDASENWQNKAFKEFSKPYFDRGKAWSFTALERNVYTNDMNDFTWFDELLSTQMAICRGSDVLKKRNGEWKIAHYLLSIAVPNENVDALVLLKKEADSLYIEKLKLKK